MFFWQRHRLSFRHPGRCSCCSYRFSLQLSLAFTLDDLKMRVEKLEDCRASSQWGILGARRRPWILGSSLAFRPWP